MSDPAIEAVKRLVGRDYMLPTDQINAAREVLKPIRELHERMDAVMQKLRDLKFEDRWGHGIEQVLDALAPLIFTSEELDQ